MTQTAKSPGHWIDQSFIAASDGYDLAARVYMDVRDRPDRLSDVEHPLDEMHRPSNCEYAGMGDHSAENCPAGGV